MEYLILGEGFFDFDMSKLLTPLCIIGIVLMILSIFLVAGSTKIDERIRAKRHSSKAKTDIPTDSGSDEITPREIQHDENASIWHHEDGSFNYYMALKIAGLVMVIASAIMIIVGMK